MANKQARTAIAAFRSEQPEDFFAGVEFGDLGQLLVVEVGAEVLPQVGQVGEGHGGGMPEMLRGQADGEKVVLHVRHLAGDRPELVHADRFRDGLEAQRTGDLDLEIGQFGRELLALLAGRGLAFRVDPFVIGEKFDCAGSVGHILHLGGLGAGCKRRCGLGGAARSAGRPPHPGSSSATGARGRVRSGNVRSAGFYRKSPD